MKNEDAQKILEAIRAEPVPKTMSDELTESQRKILLAFEVMQQAIAEKQAADIINGMEKVIERRDKSNRSFWWAVYQGFKQGINQSFEKLDRLFSGQDKR